VLRFPRGSKHFTSRPAPSPLAPSIPLPTLRPSFPFNSFNGCHSSGSSVDKVWARVTEPRMAYPLACLSSPGSQPLLLPLPQPCSLFLPMTCPLPLVETLSLLAVVNSHSTFGFQLSVYFCSHYYCPEKPLFINSRQYSLPSLTSLQLEGKVVSDPCWMAHSHG
jgi:hypothetical protein